MARVLITGASGLLGANLVLHFATEHDVVAVFNKHPIVFPEASLVQADLSQPGVAGEVIAGHRPEWVIHCAAMTNVDRCEQDEAGAYLLNREMARWVARASTEQGAQLVHISTDAVFDGRRGGYREEQRPHPINVYGRSKLAGEQAVKHAHPRAIICRTNIFGWNALSKLSLAEWFLDSLESERRTPGFSDVWVTPLLVNDLAGILVQMLEADLKGTYQVVGADCVSKYEFGVRLARVFHLATELIEPVSVDEAQLRAPRPKRLCLDGRKAARALDLSLPRLNDGLKRFRALRDDGYRARLKSLEGAVHDEQSH